jgi:hypothetical protein
MSMSPKRSSMCTNKFYWFRMLVCLFCRALFFAILFFSCLLILIWRRKFRTITMIVERSSISRPNTCLYSTRPMNKCYGLTMSSFRPLQHIHRTVYSLCSTMHRSSLSGDSMHSSSKIYTTTNMTYGSFHYNNWTYMQKLRTIRNKRSSFVHMCSHQNNKTN